MMKNSAFEGDRTSIIKSLMTIFFVACVVGWLYETILEVFIYKTGFSNRGFLFGPWLPVYGFGVLAFLPGFLWVSDKHINKVLKIALTAVFCALVATFIELVTSYILELSTGGWLWNYNEYFCNFQGRIALDTSLRFGVGGTALLYALVPFAGFIKRHPWLQNVFCIGVGCMLIDFVIRVLPL